MWTVSFSVPKHQNIEIRSSVQQRPIFTIIYHSCPSTQGLITPYMVNKPLTCSRQYVVHKKSPSTVTKSRCSNSGHIFTLHPKKKRDGLRYAGLFRSVWMQSPFYTSASHQCDMHLLEAALRKQTTPEAIAGCLNNHRLFFYFCFIQRVML